MRHLNVKFNRAYLRLAVIYTGIVMLLSLVFSFTIYNMASKEIGRGLGKQNVIVRNITGIKIILPELERLRLEQLEESQNRLRNNLIILNLLILFASAAGSYFLSKRMLRPVELAVDAQNRFASDASHELRTPLTAMKTEIEVALRDKKMGAVEARKLLQSNLEEVGKLESLSNSLLKLARNEAAEPDFADVDLSEVITDAYMKVEGLAEKKSIGFINEAGSCVIRGEKQSLIELFVILMDNAIKYSPENSTIRITTKRSRNEISVAIADQGVGIKASDLPFIFNRFYRANNSRHSEKVSGYGLGLSIAKQIVDLHDGKIIANSKPGKGSEFILSFKSI